MASGDQIMQLGPLGATQPLANPARMPPRNIHSVLAFSSTVQETAYFDNITWPPQFPAANGCTVKLHGTFAGATATATTVNVAFERIGTTQDIDADSFATAKAVVITPSTTSGIPSTGSTTFTQAEMDSIANGEWFRIAVIRPTGGLAGDFQLGVLELLVT